MMCAVEMASCGMIYIPRSMKTGTGVQAILRFCHTYTHTHTHARAHTHRQQGDLISLLFSLLTYFEKIE
jgi:hypothetical protein